MSQPGGKQDQTGGPRRRGNRGGGEPRREEQTEPRSSKEEKMLVYAVRDLIQRVEDTNSRLDSIEENQKVSMGSEGVSGEAIPPIAFSSVQDRSQWEGRAAALARFHTRAVSATGLLGTHQEEILGLLEEKQGFSEGVDEANLEFAAHISKHELLRNKRTKTPMSERIIGLIKYLAIVAAAVVVLVGLLQPANFALVVGGLENVRNLLIIVSVVAVIAIAYFYFAFSSRNKQGAIPE